MRNPLRVTLLLGVLLSLGLSLGYWLGTPRLLWASPDEGATRVLPDTQVRLGFSRPLQMASLESYLTFEPSMQGTFRWQDGTLVFTPANAWPAGVTIRARLQAGVRASGFPSLPLRQGVEWSFTIRQPSIVYLYPATGPANLYLLNPASGVARSLVYLSGGVLDFEISADGAMLIFSVRQENGSAIYKLNLDEELQSGVTTGSEEASTGARPPELIISCGQALCGALALSPGGDYLAYERGMLPGSGGPEYFQVWIAPLSEMNREGPFPAIDSEHQTTQPTWSSNGLLAIYDSEAAAYIFIEPGVGERGRFINQTGQGGAWYPGGREFLAPEIVFLDSRYSSSLTELETTADSHLILYELEQGASRDLTSGEGIEDMSPVISPDGKYLAFARKYLDAKRWTPGRQLWVARADNQEARALTNEPLFNHYQFAWSPSGDQLAFVRFNQSALTEPPEIWIIDLLSGSEIRLVVGGYSPLWIP